MPNANYQRGVRWERTIMAQYKAEGFSCSRTAGSHSSWDVIAVKDNHPVCLIQAKCLKTGTKKQAETMIEKFRAAPPLISSPYYFQIMLVLAMGDHTTTEGVI